MPHCVTLTSESADASTLTRRKYSAQLTPRSMISLGRVGLQSTKPAFVGCRLPLAEEQEQQLQAQLSRPARCALPLDVWRRNYGSTKQATVHHHMGREMVWKNDTQFSA